MSARLPLADIQFISEFAAFCRGKVAGYNFEDLDNCAIAQFGKSGGVIPESICVVKPWGSYHLDCNTPIAGAIAREPKTFSALADRLESLIADAPMVRP